MSPVSQIVDLTNGDPDVILPIHADELLSLKEEVSLVFVGHEKEGAKEWF